MDKKPSVIPSKEQMDSVASERAKIEAYEAEKMKVTSEIYSTAVSPEDTPYEHMSAVEMMKQRTQQQLAQREQTGTVVDPNLAEKSAARVYDEAARQKNEEQMRLRDEQLRKNQEQTQNFQRYTEEATNRKYEPVNQNTTNMQNTNYTPPTPPSTPVVNNVEDFGKTPSNIDPYILELSQPNYNAPFDVIPLPSQGKTYRTKKASIRVGYMTTADENILTSPNLLQSGEFLEILINRKILEPGLRYRDLLPGDRNAIMIWLRATGYGEMYPVTLLDELDEPFDTEVNLNDLKTKKLNVEPDEEGLFSFILPLAKSEVKFKLLTCGDIDDIDKLVEKEKKDGVLINNTTTYKYEKMIVEVNGNRDKSVIKDLSNSMRISDAKKFNDYIDSIESGIDLNIEVTTPGGGSIATFLPLNINFFWPNL
jgi:hypothetical protein